MWYKFHDLDPPFQTAREFACELRETMHEGGHEVFDLEPDVASMAILPWYQGDGTLLRLADRERGTHLDMLFPEEAFNELDFRHAVMLDGLQDTLYDFNRRHGFQMLPDMMSDYCRFFFDQVEGHKGRFRLVESGLDAVRNGHRLTRFELSDAELELCREAEAYIDPCLLPPDGDGMVLRRYLVFKKGLFSAEIMISPTGEIRVQDETLLILDIVTRDPAPATVNLATAARRQRQSRAS